MLNRLFQNWAYAAPPMALLLIGLSPFMGAAIALPLFLFIPLAIWIFAAVPAALSIHIVSAVLVIVLHAGIMIAARRPA